MIYINLRTFTETDTVFPKVVGGVSSYRNEKDQNDWLLVDTKLDHYQLTVLNSDCTLYWEYNL